MNKMGDLYIFMGNSKKDDSVFKEDLYAIGEFLKPYLIGSEDILSIVEQVKSIVKRLS